MTCDGVGRSVKVHGARDRDITGGAHISSMVEESLYALAIYRLSTKSFYATM